MTNRQTCRVEQPTDRIPNLWGRTTDRWDAFAEESWACFTSAEESTAVGFKRTTWFDIEDNSKRSTSPFRKQRQSVMGTADVASCDVRQKGAKLATRKSKWYPTRDFLCKGKIHQGQRSFQQQGHFQCEQKKGLVQITGRAQRMGVPTPIGMGHDA